MDSKMSQHAPQKIYVPRRKFVIQTRSIDFIGTRAAIRITFATKTYTKYLLYSYSGEGTLIVGKTAKSNHH